MECKRDETEMLIHDLYMQYRSYIFVVINKSIYHKEDAEEVLQEVFLTATIKYNKLKSHPDKRAWLVTTAHNIVKNYNRKYMKQYKYLEYTEDVKGGNMVKNINMEGFENDIIEKLRYSDFMLQEVVEKAFYSLSKDEYKLYKMKFQEHMSLQEIGVEFGINKIAANTRIYRMKNKIRDYIINYGRNKI